MEKVKQAIEKVMPYAQSFCTPHYIYLTKEGTKMYSQTCQLCNIEQDTEEYPDNRFPHKEDCPITILKEFIGS